MPGICWAVHVLFGWSDVRERKGSFRGSRHALHSVAVSANLRDLDKVWWPCMGRGLEAPLALSHQANFCVATTLQTISNLGLHCLLSCPPAGP